MTDYFQESQLRMNCSTYKLEYLEKNICEKIDCFHIDYFLSVENRIEIKISTNTYIPQTQSFYFKNHQHFRKLESFLKDLHKDRSKIPKDQLFSYFLNREFESLAKNCKTPIPCADVKKYVQNLNVFDDSLLYRIDKVCTQKEWCTLLNKIIKKRNTE